MPEIARLQATVVADVTNAEEGFARISGAIGGFAKASAIALAGATLAIGAAGASAVHSAADFESTLSGIKAVSGATNEQMKSLSSLALQLGKDTVFSASEAGKGIEELVKGGLSISDIMGGAAKSTLDLAAAGGVSLPEAATIAANALAQFGLKGKDMAHVSDLIAGAANASALDVGQFKFSLQAAGAVASTVGFSFDGLATAIAVMGKAGIVGSDAGTSLKTMFLNLQPSTKAATAEMQRLGIITKDGANAFFDAHGKVKSMADVAGILQNATKNLTQAQRLQALQTIFGSDAIRAAAVFAKEGAAGFGEMAAEMGKVTAASVGAERLNNLSGDIEQLKGSIETASIAFGTAFLPALRGAAQWATSFVNSLIPWVERIGPQVVSVLQNIGAAVGDLVRSGGDVGLFADDIRESFGIDLTPFVVAIRAVETVIGNIATGFREGGLGGAFAAWLTEAGTFGTAVLAWIGEQVNPIATRLEGWATAFVGWIAPKIPGILSALGALATTVWDWITGTALPTITARLGQWAGAFVSWVAPVVVALPGRLLEVATAVLGWVGQQAASIGARLGEWGGQFLAWVGPIIPQIPGALVGLATAALTWIGSQVKPIADKLVTWAGAFLGWVGPLVTALPGKLLAIGTAALTWIGDNYQPILDKLGRWKDAFVDWIGPLVTALPGQLLSIVTAALTWIGDNYQPILDKLGGWKDAFLNWIGPLITALPIKLGEVKDAVVTWVTTTAIPAMKTAWDGLSPVIVPVIVDALKKARDDLKPVWNEITSFMSDFEPTGKRLERLFNTIGTVIADTVVPALQKLWTGGGVGGGNGKSFWQNFADGINAFSEKWEKMIDQFSDAVRALKPFSDMITPLLPFLNQILPGGAGASLAPAVGALIGGGFRPPAVVNVGGGVAPGSSGSGASVVIRDSGGPGVAGQSYLIGTGAQPERFVPNQAGMFFPNGGAARDDRPIHVSVRIGSTEFARLVAVAEERNEKRGMRTWMSSSPR